MEAEISLAKLFDDPVLQAYKMHIQRWPRDIDLKKGLLYGLWKDLKTIVSARDASITDDSGSGIPAREFLRNIILQMWLTTRTIIGIMQNNIHFKKYFL